MFQNLKPKKHQDFQIEDRVIVANHGSEMLTKGTGIIIGVANAHDVFHYIVLLDSPLSSEPYVNWRGMIISGEHLRKI